MDNKIKKLLEQNKIKFKTTEHRKVYTAFNEAETQKIDPKSVLKCVLVKLNKPALFAIKEQYNFVLVAIPAKKRVDFKKIAKTINVLQQKNFKVFSKAEPKLKKPVVITVKMAQEKDITNKLKTKVGLLHPFGQIFNLPVLLDKKLTAAKKLTVSAGSYTESLSISPKELLKVTGAVLGNYTE